MPARQPEFDEVIADIARYVDTYVIRSPLARETARLCLIDSLGCALEALAYPDCTKLLGPVVPGTQVPAGARVPGTPHVLDPVKAAFDWTALTRWLDYNDAFYGRTVIHPSDVLGGLIAVADWESRTRVAAGRAPLTMKALLDAAILAYEVMGQLALENAFTTRMGIDHVVLVKVACAAVVVKMLGGTRREIENAVSNAWIDGQVLATFRRKPNAGTRKSWAAADAASRGVWLALLSLRGEMGYRSALTAKTWGFYDVLNEGEPFAFQRAYGSYVMENVQFKISYPAGFHAQTAAEAAVRMHAQVKDRIDDIGRVEVWSHQYGLAILDKTGPLANAADRDHCIQYIVAIGLIFGRLESSDYEDAVAVDRRIDVLRAKMVVREEPRYSAGFIDPAKRSNANAIRVHFRDGTATPRLEVEFPVGHPRRRREGLPLLMQKFEQNLARVYAEPQRSRIRDACSDGKRLGSIPVHEWVDLLV